MYPDTVGIDIMRKPLSSAEGHHKAGGWSTHAPAHLPGVLHFPDVRNAAKRPVFQTTEGKKEGGSYCCLLLPKVW